MTQGHIKNTGYDIVHDTMVRNNFEVSSLLKEAHFQETDYLEFKADPFIRETALPDEKQDDYSWNILKAVIAFANTCGGCILIGMDDSGKKTVPLRNRENDKTPADLDEFKRELYSLVLEKRKFSIKNPNTKRANRIQITVDPEQIRSLVTLQDVFFQDENLIAVLVQESEHEVFFEEDQEEVFLVRELGAIGKNRKLSMRELRSYFSKRPEISRIIQYFSNIPLANDSFVGRENELIQLHKLLSEIPVKIPLVHAPAGTGKTELAFRYAQIYREEYCACIYIRAQECTSIPQAFSQILLDPHLVKQFSINLPEEIINQEDRFRIIRDSLISEAKGPVLILLDNLENPGVLNPAELDKYLAVPGREKIRLYATSRLDRVKVAAADTLVPFALSGLDVSSGIDLLSKKYQPISTEEKEAAKTLVEYLDGNAWALDLIGEELKQRSCHYEDDYRCILEEIRKEPLKPFSEALESETIRIKHGCLDPIKLLSPTLKRLSQNAHEFAVTAAFCNPDYIYTGWFQGVYKKKHAEKLSVRDFDKAVRELKDLHIISGKYESPGQQEIFSSQEEHFELVKIHRLTRSVLLAQLGDKYQVEQLVFRKFFLKELLNALYVEQSKAMLPTIKTFSERTSPAKFNYPILGSSAFSACGISPLNIFTSIALPFELFSQAHRSLKFVYPGVVGRLCKSAGVVTRLLFGIKKILDIGSKDISEEERSIIDTQNQKDFEDEKDWNTQSGQTQLLQGINNIKKQIEPPPEWLNTIFLFMFSFEEIKEYLDEEDKACVEEFLKICFERLSSVHEFSSLYHRKMEDKAVALFFMLHPIITDILPKQDLQETYLETGTVLYHNLVSYRNLSGDEPQEQQRLDYSLEYFIKQVSRWQKKEKKDFDRFLKENLATQDGKKYRRLDRVYFPDPEFYEEG